MKENGVFQAFFLIKNPPVDKKKKWKPKKYFDKKF